MEKNKKKTIIIVILTILLLVAIADICYQTIKYQDLNEKYTNIEKENNANKQKLKETTQPTENDVTVQYEKFLENAKKSRETKFNEYSWQDIPYNDSVVEDTKYGFAIKPNGDLIMDVWEGNIADNSMKYDGYKVDTNVLTMSLVRIGNGGYKTLYFLKEDGNIYSLNIDSILADNKDVKVEKQNFKNIVEIKQYSFGDSIGGGGWGPVFIDIEGNIHSSN